MFNRIKSNIIRSFLQNQRNRQGFVKNKQKYSQVNTIYKMNNIHKIINRKYYVNSSAKSNYNGKPPNSNSNILLTMIFASCVYIVNKKI